MQPLAILLTLFDMARTAFTSASREVEKPTQDGLEVAAALRRDVEAIASEPHNLAHYDALRRAAAYT